MRVNLGTIRDVLVVVEKRLGADPLGELHVSGGARSTWFSHAEQVQRGLPRSQVHTRCVSLRCVVCVLALCCVSCAFCVWSVLSIVCALYEPVVGLALFCGRFLCSVLVCACVV